MPLPFVDSQSGLGVLCANAKERLAAAGIKEASILVDLLASHIFGIARHNLMVSGDLKPTASKAADFKQGIERLANHEPLQYVLGESVFMGYTLKVDPSVLIPRPETEQLVELVVNALKALPKEGERPSTYGLDIGTGSANIPIAVCKLIPGTRILGVDVSTVAIEVARKNVELNSLTDYIAIDCCDVLKSIPAVFERFDFIISNPPYISAEEFSYLEPNVRLYEPGIALTDSSDGLTFYKRIADIAPRILSPTGQVFLEVSYDQALPVSAIFGGAGYREIVISRDYAGIERFVSCRVPDMNAALPDQSLLE